MTRDSTSLSAFDPDELTITEVDPPPGPELQLEIDAASAQPDEVPPSGGEIDPSKLDLDALKVVRRLLQHGHQAYFVGGCVRDLLLGKKPKDFDIATSAHPGEVRSIFRNCRLIGRRFRLAHVYFKGGKVVEVSTFRANPSELESVAALQPADPETAPGALPEEAESEAEEDLLITQDNVFGTVDQDARRRDFTINGLFYDVDAGAVVDYVRGRRDLDERFIRTIGNPEIRLREDPVRLLRAVRFACKLDFDFEPRTYAAMEGAVEDLPRCAPPRLLEETFKLIRGGVASPAFKLLSALDALRLLLPPIHQFLQQHSADSQSAFYTYTDALDRRTRSSGPPLEDAILLAVLLYPLSRAAPVASEEDRPAPEQLEAVSDEASEPSPAAQGDPASSASGTARVSDAIEDLLAEFVQTARLPRRIAERCKALLLAQRTLSGERRRRGSLASFRRHPLFQEALTVFECVVEASGQFEESLRAWKEGGAPQQSSVGSAAPSGRRRRRRRRGSGPSNGESAGEGDPEVIPPQPSQDSGSPPAE